MKTKKKISKIRQKELKRVKQAISRLEKKGYQIGAEFKDLAKISTQKLKTITPKRLRSSSTGWWQGEKISGKELYKKQRQEMKLIRKRKKDGVIFQISDDTYKDGTNVDDLKSDVILRHLYELCDSYDNDVAEYIRNNARTLRNLLDSEISLYGKKAVAISAEENARQNYDTGERIIFASTEEKLQYNVSILRENIRGYIPNETESEQDAEYNMLLESTPESGEVEYV